MRIISHSPDLSKEYYYNIVINIKFTQDNVGPNKQGLDTMEYFFRKTKDQK